jgi:diguanylate cyclase (GGDEF)-like protein/PAS domain S-box-containing protein
MCVLMQRLRAPVDLLAQGNAHRSDDVSAPDAVSPICEPAAAPQSLRVVIVDVGSAASSYARSLRNAGYQSTIRRAESEAEFVRALYPKPDLVLAHCRAGGFNAEAVLLLLRSRGLHLPVIVLHEEAAEATALECLQLGALDYLSTDRLGRLGPAVQRCLREREALANRWLAEQQLRDEADRLGALVDTQREIAVAALDLPAVMTIIAKRTQQLTRADTAAVELVEGSEAVQKAASGGAVRHNGTRRPLAGTLSGCCVQTGQIIRCDDVDSGGRSEPASGMEIGARSVIVVPLFSEQKVVGVLKVLAARSAAFDDRDVKLLDLVAGLLSAAISNAMVFEAKKDLVRERTSALEALQESDYRFRTIIDRSPVGICIVDRDGRFEIVNDALAAIFEYDMTELIGAHFNLVVPEKHREQYVLRVAAAMNTRSEQSAEMELQSKSGRLSTVLATTIAIQGADGHPRIATFVIDISERKSVETHLEYMAHHDSLTGLPNRLLFHDRVDQALLSALRNTTSVAILLIDLNHFKEINDTLGHDAGDELLREVATRMQDALRASDTVARLGGDEFAVLLPHQSESGAIHIANKLLSTLALPMVIYDRILPVSGSIGIAVYPAHGSDAATLLRHTDVAMYTAKAAGGGYAVYAAELDRHSPTRLQLSGELRQAIGEHQLRLHFQPIVDCRAGGVVRMEALVRWQHPVHGMLSPDHFVPLAEHSGLIMLLSLWVLEESLRQCREWRDAGLDLSVAVNVSIRTVQEPQFPDLVRALLQYYDLAPARLTFEVTESMLMAQPDQAASVLRELIKLGIRISIDDFGTGHSSLNYLKRLPVHELKIDQSFMQNLVTEQDASIVSFILGLGGALDREVVVEGVESEEMLQWLIDLGCDRVQGYHIGRPIPGEEVPAWARDSRWTKETQRCDPPSHAVD